MCVEHDMMRHEKIKNAQGLVWKKENVEGL